MTLERMHFNIKYRYGQYYKIIDEDTSEIVGGIFGFDLDQPNMMKIAQFYIKDDYRSRGYGHQVIEEFINNS